MQDAHSELAQLERAFEGERSNRLNPPISDAGLALMTREELLARCYALSQSLFLEQQKTRELEAKHTRDHRNVVAAGVAIKRYQKLQDVLVQTRNSLAEREGEAQRITAYKETVRSQEEVIRKLEAVVERLAGERSRAQEEMSTFKKRLEEANEQLRREMTVNESGESICALLEEFPPQESPSELPLTSRWPVPDADMYAKLQGRITELWQQLEESQKEKSALQEQLQVRRQITLQCCSLLAFCTMCPGHPASVLPANTP